MHRAALASQGNSLNVAHLYCVYEDDACVDLVMECCDGGELWRGIRRGDYDEAGALARVRCCAAQRQRPWCW